MLVLTTLVLVGAYYLSSSNSRAVANAQLRNEAMAAANESIEELVSSPFWTNLQTSTNSVDIDNNGTTDYTVTLAKPVCITSSQISTATDAPSSVSLGTAFNVSTSTNYLTEWELGATAVDARGGGATVEVRQGVRVQLTASEAASSCP